MSSHVKCTAGHTPCGAESEGPDQTAPSDYRISGHWRAYRCIIKVHILFYGSLAIWTFIVCLQPAVPFSHGMSHDRNFLAFAFGFTNEKICEERDFLACTNGDGTAQTVPPCILPCLSKGNSYTAISRLIRIPKTLNRLCGFVDWFHLNA